MSCEDLCSADSQLEHLLRKQLQFLSWEIKSIIDKIVTKVKDQKDLVIGENPDGSLINIPRQSLVVVLVLKKISL